MIYPEYVTAPTFSTKTYGRSKLCDYIYNSEYLAHLESVTIVKLRLWIRMICRRVTQIDARSVSSRRFRSAYYESAQKP